MLIKRLPIIFLSLISSVTFAQQYGWPFPNPNQQHDVVGSVEVPDIDVIKIFPNPTQDIFRVQAIFTRQKRIFLEILDLKGAAVITRQYPYVDEIFESFDLSTVASGMYLVKITNESGVKTWKVIKN